MRTSPLIVPLVNAVVGFAEFILGFRFLFKLFGASPSAPLARWIYETSLPLLSPFLGMFPSPVLEGGVIVEFTTLFALIVYELGRYLVLELVMYLRRPSAN